MGVLALGRARATHGLPYNSYPICSQVPLDRSHLIALNLSFVL